MFVTEAGAGKTLETLYTIKVKSTQDFWSTSTALLFVQLSKQGALYDEITLQQTNLIVFHIVLLFYYVVMPPKIVITENQRIKISTIRSLLPLLEQIRF